MKMKPITVKAMRLRPVALPLVERLSTSYGAEPFKSAILVELETEAGATGWGEVSTKIRPSYNDETMGTAQHVLQEFLLPLVLNQTIANPTQLPALVKAVRGHNFAKHGLEAAVWDAFAQTNDLPLADCFAAHLPEGHSPRGYATVGVSIGIQPTEEATLEIITRRLNEGYGRIKLKIKPGWDLKLAQAVRAQYPKIMLMLDANSAYTMDDAAHLRQLDDYELLMIEQPLGYNDIFEHSQLQQQLETPICLDESIHNANDLRLALALAACKIINLKPARVGGFTESLEIYKLCVENEVPLWVGGMLETGVGRAANLAFASLPGVTLPCDISATSRYFDPDITEPAFVLGANSTIAVPTEPGIGVVVQTDRVQEAGQRWQEQYPYAYPSLMVGQTT